MAKKLMLLINPKAGKGQYKGVLDDILPIFCAADYQPTVFFTQAAGDATKLIKEYAAEYDTVTCLGGDGTLSEVNAGMMQISDKRPVGYIPVGTANDVAKTLGLYKKNHVLAAQSIVNGRSVPYDIGQFGTDKFFTYIAAFGAFTEVSYATPQERKQALGHIAYMLEAVKCLPKLSSYKAIVEHDGGVLQDDFIFGAVTNSTSVAGLVKLDSDKVNLSDGMFEVLLVRRPQAIKDLNEIANAVLANNFDQQNVVFLKSSEVRIMFEKPVSWTRDGEDGGTHQDVFIVNRHPGVDIIV